MDRKKDGILLMRVNPNDLYVEETAEIRLEPVALKDFFLECVAARIVPDRYRDNRDQVHLIINDWQGRPEEQLEK